MDDQKPKAVVAQADNLLLKRLGEFALFLLLSALLAAIPIIGRTEAIALTFLQQSPSFLINPMLWLQDVELWMPKAWPLLINTLQLFVLLLLPRFIRKLSVLLCAAIFWLVATCAILYFVRDYPIIREARASTEMIQLGILVPDFLWGTRNLLLPLFPLALAIAASNRMESRRRFAAGWITGFLLLWSFNGFFSIPFAAGITLSRLLPAYGAYLALPLLVWLPSYRNSLLALLDGQRTSNRDLTLMLFGGIMMAWLVLSGGLTHLQIKTGRAVRGLIEFEPRPPGALNARSAMAPFARDAMEVALLPDLQELLANPPGVEEPLTDEQLLMIQHADELFAPLVEALHVIARADYLRHPGRFNTTRLRNTLRYLHLRTLRDLQQQSDLQFPKDIDLMLHVAHLFHGDDSAGTSAPMVATALRNQACRTFEQFYRAIRKDEKQAERLHGWIIENRWRIQGSFPFSQVKQRETTFWPVLPLLGGITVTDADRLLRIYQTPGIHLDLIRIALALDDHHRARGHYPNVLEELIPTFLPHLPMDPEKNQPYHYTLLEGNFRLERADMPEPFNVELEAGGPPNER